MAFSGTGKTQEGKVFNEKKILRFELLGRHSNEDKLVVEQQEWSIGIFV